MRLDRAGWVLVVGLASAGVGTATARAGDVAQEAFDAATALAADGRHREAVDRLAALAERSPESALADDALFLAAELCEERLADPARAALLYRRLVADHPRSRVALAAERRLRDLDAALGPDGTGAAALGEFTAIQMARPEIGAAAAIARAEALVAANPAWPGRTAVELWIAGELQRAGQLDRAAAILGRLATGAATPAERFRAALGAGDLALVRGDLDAAAAWYERLDPGDDRARRELAADAIERLVIARTRAARVTAAWAVTVACGLLLAGSLRLAGGSWRAAARAIARPPGEVLFLAPVIAILCAAAFTGFSEIGPAVAWIGAGGLVVTWVSGAALREHRRRELVAVHAMIAAAAVLAICYIALHRANLVELIAQTVTFGPDS